MQFTHMLLKDLNISSLFNDFLKPFSVSNNIKYLFVNQGDYLRNISMTLSACVIMQINGEFAGVMFPWLKYFVKQKTETKDSFLTDENIQSILKFEVLSYQ